MAGRGTDIILGGNTEFMAKQEMRKQGYSEELIEQSTAHNETDNQDVLNARNVFSELEKKFQEQIQEEKEKVIAAGGLKILGTERHESRRIDNQLRGRSGRQGDIGESRFYIALDDDLMKIFGGDMITNVYNTLKADEDMPIEMGFLSKAVENAQRRIEGQNFSIRKRVLQYDDVMNTQREIIYKERREVLDGENLNPKILKMIETIAQSIISNHTSNGENMENINKEGLLAETKSVLGIDNLSSLEENGSIEDITEELTSKALELYKQKEIEIGSENLRELERVVMLKVVDQKWMDHIDSMEELKTGIGLRAYGQKDPIVQYRLEGFDMFDQMIYDIKYDVVKILLHIVGEQRVERKEVTKISGEKLQGAINTLNRNKVVPTKTTVTTVKNEGPEIGRNEPCPCGSGKKYKQCCGK